MTSIDQTGNTFVDGTFETIEDASHHLRQLHYLSGGDGLFAIYVTDRDGKGTMYYIHKDYQGSFETITDKQATIVEKLNYDPWGRRRNPHNWTFTDVPESYTFDRGYTGHEHLEAFGLINMNGRMYDPMLGRFLSPDNYVQAPDYTQNFNRYSYVLNNPLKYTDPSGEWFFVLPNIGWSKQGGFSLGVSVGVGFPGGLSVQAGVGYNFKSSDAYVFVSASAAFNTVYASYSSRSGASLGYTVGLTQFSGFPISTNALTIGGNYNITHDSWGANVSAWQIDQGGWTFNPSVSVMVYPEHTTNLVRGQGFRNNDAVLSRFVESGNHQDAIDYFGFKGKYIEDQPSPGHTDEYGNITYNEVAFKSGFDYLHYVASEEMFHRRDVLAGNYDDVDWSDDLQRADAQAEGEYKANMYQYRNQGLFPRHGQTKLMLQRITYYGDWIGKFNGNYSENYGFQPRPWHIIYKIPRKW